MNDQEKSIRDFLIKPWWQFQFRHAYYCATKLKLLEKKYRKEALTWYAYETNFLKGRTYDPGLYRYIKKKMKIKWVTNHLIELGHLILLDLLHPEHATLKGSQSKPNEINKKMKEFINQRPGDRTTRRIIKEEYPEIFFTLPKNVRYNMKDERLSPFTTIFTEIPYSKEEDIKAALELLAVQGLAEIPHKKRLDDIRLFHAHIRLVEPEDIISIRKMHDSLNRSLELILTVFGSITKEKGWIIHAIQEGTIVVETIYTLIEEAVALRWYRTRKSKTRKINLLKKIHPLRYTEEDAKLAVEENWNWFQDPVLVADYIFRGANAYGSIGKHNAAIRLYKECLKQIPLEKIDEGLCFHNLAFEYRRMNKPRKYLIGLRNALKVFEDVESDFDIGVTWAFIADAYFLLHNESAYRDATSRAMDIVASSRLDDFKLTKAYLYIADCAQRIRDRNWEFQALVRSIDPSSRLSDDEYFIYLNQRLADFNEGKDTFTAEMGLGKPRRPPEFRWRVDEHSSSFLPLSPRKKNNC